MMTRTGLTDCVDLLIAEAGRSLLNEKFNSLADELGDLSEDQVSDLFLA